VIDLPSLPGLPLPAGLAQLLVAFTIEFDNAFEERIPHRTAVGPAAGGRGPWLVSQAMWANFLRFVDQGEAPFEELKGPARMTNFGGLRRWGYVRVGPEPRRVVRLTANGEHAAEIFRPLAGEIEDRWTSRFGTPEIAALREALGTVLNHADRALPRYLPVTAVQILRPVRWWADIREDPARLDLSALLAQVLLLFTHGYDQVADLPLQVAANALRVVPPGPDGVPIRDLPRLAGVAREQIASSVKLLERLELLVQEPDPSGRGKRAVLTARGAGSQERYRRVVAGVSDAWRARFGEQVVDGLVSALSAVRSQSNALIEGLTPEPSGWRANPPYTSLTKALLADPAAALPHYPMVSHRGGYPDGS
jgi:hypothetical protein